METSQLYFPKTDELQIENQKDWDPKGYLNTANNMGVAHRLFIVFQKIMIKIKIHYPFED